MICGVIISISETIIEPSTATSPISCAPAATVRLVNMLSSVEPYAHEKATFPPKALKTGPSALCTDKVPDPSFHTSVPGQLRRL